MTALGPDARVGPAALEALRRAVGADAVRTSPAELRRWPGQPRCAISLSDPGHAIAAVQATQGLGLPVAWRAEAPGEPPVGAGAVVLDYSRLRSIDLSRADEGLVQVQAGATGARVEGALRERGRTLGLRPRGWRELPMAALLLGGAVAGPGVSHHGSLRERLGDFEMVWVDGRLIQARARGARGPREADLLLGLSPPMGFPLSMWLRVEPIAERAWSARFRFGHTREALSAMRRLLHAGIRPKVCEVRRPLTSWALPLLARTSGAEQPDPVQRAQAALAWQGLRRPTAMRIGAGLTRLGGGHSELRVVLEGDPGHLEAEVALLRGELEAAGGRAWDSEHEDLQEVPRDEHMAMQEARHRGAVCLPVQVAVPWSRALEVALGLEDSCRGIATALLSFADPVDAGCTLRGVLTAVPATKADVHRVTDNLQRAIHAAVRPFERHRAVLVRGLCLHLDPQGRLGAPAAADALLETVPARRERVARIMAPASTSELAQLLQDAAAARAATIFGVGPSLADLVPPGALGLDLSHLSGVGPPDRVDACVRAEAGAQMGRIARRAAHVGMQLDFYEPHLAELTVADMLLETGSWRSALQRTPLGPGATDPRCAVLGMELILADGRALVLPARPYALGSPSFHALFSGEGRTFGVPVAAVLGLRAAARVRHVFTCHGELDALYASARRLLAVTRMVQRLSIRMLDDGRAMAVVRVDGRDPCARRVLDHVRTFLPDACEVEADQDWVRAPLPAGGGLHRRAWSEPRPQDVLAAVRLDRDGVWEVRAAATPAATPGPDLLASLRIALADTAPWKLDLRAVDVSSPG